VSKWIVRQKRKSFVEVEVEAETEEEAIELGQGMDGTETDNWLYDASARLA
jgi:hypothetical protein